VRSEVGAATAGTMTTAMTRIVVVPTIAVMPTMVVVTMPVVMIIVNTAWKVLELGLRL
jgi:hypothetical protein